MSSRSMTLQVVLGLLDKTIAPLKGLAQNSNAVSKELRKNKDALERLEEAGAKLKAFEKLRVNATQSNSAIRENQQRLAAVTREINNSTAPTKALLRERDQLTRQSVTLNTRYQQERSQMMNLTRQLKGVDMGSGSLAQRKQHLKQQIESATKAVVKHEAALERLNKRQESLKQLSLSGTNLKQSGQTVAMHGAGAVALGGSGLRGMYQLADEGMEFDAVMSKVQGMARLDKNSDQMKALRDQAKKLGAETMFSATDAARGQAFLAIAGFTPESIQAAMPGLLDMALAGDVDLGRTADIASNILGGFGIDPSEMGKVADVLTQVFTSSNVSLESLGETMKYVGPVAAAAGMELEEAAAMAGLLGNVGIQGSQAGTTLKAMLLRLSAPASAGRKALEGLGVSALDSQDNLRKVTDIIADVASATKGMGSGQQLEYLKQIFGAEPAAGMAEIIKQSGMGGLEKYIREVYDNEGAARNTAKTMADNLVGDLDQLSSAWSGLKIDLFEEQNSGLRSLVQSLTEVLGKVATWAKENPALIAGVAKWGVIVLGVVTVLGSLALAIGTGMIFVGGLIKVFALAAKSTLFVTQAFSILSKAMLANPIFLAIAALAGAAYLIYRNWDDMVSGFKQMWSDFTEYWADKSALLKQDWEYLTASISGFFSSMASKVASIASKIWSRITEAFSGGIVGVSALLLDWSPLSALYIAFKPLLSWLGLDLPDRFSEAGANLISGFIKSIKDGMGAVKDAVVGFGKHVTGSFKNVLGIRSPSRVFMELGGDTMDGLTLGLQAEQGGPLKQVTSLGKQMAAVGALAFAGSAAAGSLPLPELPALQSARNSPLFDNRPPISSRPAAAAPVAGDTITINVHAAPGMDTAELARLVQQELQKHQQQQQQRRRSTFGDLD